MKKFTLFITIILLPAILSACGNDTPQTPPDTEISSTPIPDEWPVNEPVNDTVVPDAPVQFEEQPAYNTIDELDPAQFEKIKNEAIDVAMLCREIYINADKGTSLNVVLSEKTVAEMVTAIGLQGYSVIDSEGKLDMQNPEDIILFGESINAGRDCETAYYEVYSDGRISAIHVILEEGIGTLITISLSWDGDNEPEVYDAGKYSLLDITYTEKGWLIYNRDISNFNIPKKFNVNSYTLVRVSPYDSKLRELSAKYIEPVGYSENNLFTSTWSEDDFGTLDFNALFSHLFGIYHDRGALLHYDAFEFYEFIDPTDLYLIPTEEFEQIVRSYFNIGPDTLRSHADYSADYGGYFFLGWQTGYYSVVPRLPVPEVVDYWYNTDGTITLKVDAVFPWHGTDRAFTHELTVCDFGDSFVYVSNYLYESDLNTLPDCELPHIRENALRRIGYS